MASALSLGVLQLQCSALGPAAVLEQEGKSSTAETLLMPKFNPTKPSPDLQRPLLLISGVRENPEPGGKASGLGSKGEHSHARTAKIL